MKKIQEVYQRQAYPVRVLQIGEGNFLRAFVDYGIDLANEKRGFNGSVAVVMPRAKTNTRFAAQDNIYSVCVRGKKAGKTYKENRVISCLDRVVSAYSDYKEFLQLAELPSLEFVISNTTEAGIVYSDDDAYEDKPPKSYPAKLTKFLFTRFEHFSGAKEKGLVMLPVELIDHNGQMLKKCVKAYAKKWMLGDAFAAWLDESCLFVDTLVDRIVTGYPRNDAAKYEQELGYEDALLDQCEPFAFWAIGEPSLEKRFPIATEDFPIVFTKDVDAYKRRKVRILNGAHTSMALGAYLAGLDYVGECMKDADIRRQLEQLVYQEIVPAFHKEDDSLRDFAASVFERFENPFVNHSLLAISLNSIAKWRARVLPSLMDYEQNIKVLPKWLTFSLAALLAFYHTVEKGDGCLIGYRNGKPYEIHDDAEKLDRVASWAALPDEVYVRKFLQADDFWGIDLRTIPGFYDAVLHHYELLQLMGIKSYIKKLGEYMA